MHENFITDDTEQMSADADQAVASAVAELALQARRYESLKLPADVARKLKLIKLSVSIPVPHDPALAAELTKIAPRSMATTARANGVRTVPRGNVST